MFRFNVWNWFSGFWHSVCSSSYNVSVYNVSTYSIWVDHKCTTRKLKANCHYKADSHVACRAHAVPLPCRAAKGLECVFPIWFTQCGCVWFTLAMPCSDHAVFLKATAQHGLLSTVLRITAWSEHGKGMALHGKCESVWIKHYWVLRFLPHSAQQTRALRSSVPFGTPGLKFENDH
jgi:hypothetical protein